MRRTATRPYHENVVNPNGTFSRITYAMGDFTTPIRTGALRNSSRGSRSRSTPGLRATLRLAARQIDVVNRFSMTVHVTIKHEKGNRSA